jgi:hypothetical protein
VLNKLSDEERAALPFDFFVRVFVFERCARPSLRPSVVMPQKDPKVLRLTNLIVEENEQELAAAARQPHPY